MALDVFEKRKTKGRGEKRSQHWACSCSHSAIHPSELKITYILFPLFLENCHGHRGGRVASCALKCLKPSQSALHCLRLSKWNTLNTHSKVWKHEIGTMVSYCSTAHIFALRCFPCLPFPLSVPWFWQFFKYLLKQLWQPGRENWNILRQSLSWRILRGKNTALKFSQNVVLDNGWNRSEKGTTYTQIH